MHIHTTRQGDTYLVGQMEDSHLKNTIDMYLRRIREAASFLKMAEQGIASPSVVVKAITRRSIDIESQKKQAERAIAQADLALQPYLQEAFLRSPELLLEIQKAVKAAYERDGRLFTPNVYLSAIVGDEDTVGLLMNSQDDYH